MRYDVFLTDKAVDQLKAVSRWWSENRSVEQAEQWYVGILETIQSLEKNPMRCPVARENKSFDFEIRELHYGLGSKKTHRAIFAIRPDRIVVYSVRHLAQCDLTLEDL